MNGHDGGWEAGLASDGHSTPRIYLALMPEGHVALMSPREARAYASRLRRALNTPAGDRDSLMDMATTLEELAAEVESPPARAAGPSVEEWNERYPVGTRVRYFPILGASTCFETITRSEAWGCSEPVVALKDFSGGKSLRHLQVL